MEYDPTETDTKDVKKSKEKTSDKKKRRSPFVIGSMVVDKGETTPKESKPEKPERTFLSLSETDNKPSKTESDNEDSPEDSETVAEAEAPVDGTLSPEEQIIATQRLAVAAKEALAEHDPNSEPEAAVGDMPAEELMDRLSNIQPGETIESIADDVANSFELEMPEAGSAEAEIETDQETVPEPATEPGDESFAEPQEVLAFDRAAEMRALNQLPQSNEELVPQPRQPASLKPNVAPLPAPVEGGIVGYFVGRRRGRIRAEKKLIPVQEKLEKQVEDLSWQIKTKEIQIRQASAEKVRRQGPAAVEAMVAKKNSIAEAKPKNTPETRKPTSEAILLQSNRAPEHIGHMLMTAESAAKKPERKADNQAAEKPINERQVASLNRNDLLRISEKIQVEGSTLRKIYETHLIGERGLRRLIAEHLRGGDLSKALRREITEREIDFERDPAMRDIAPTDAGQSGPAPTGGGQAALNRMVEKAAASLPASEELAFHKARADFESDQLHKHQQRRRAVDITFVTVIAGLLVAVIYLAFFRG